MISRKLPKFSLAILLLQLGLLLVQIFLTVPQLSMGLIQPCQDCALDAIAVAAQMGRLDVVSLIFAMSGIFLAVMGFWGFFSIKSQSEDIAHRAATEEARRVAEEKIDQTLSALGLQYAQSGRSSMENLNLGESEKITDSTGG